MQKHYIIYIFFCLYFLTSCKNNQKSQSKEFHKKDDKSLRNTTVTDIVWTSDSARFDKIEYVQVTNY